MAGRKLTVVISQAPGKNPVKRQLEEEIATQLMLSGAAEVSIVPNLYDLTADHTGMLWLKSLKGDLVVLAWLYPRAIRWVLDRNGVKGQVGESRLNVVETDEEDFESGEDIATNPAGIGATNVPSRSIFAIDLRNDPTPATYLQEIERLSKALAVPLVQLSGLFGDSLASSSGLMKGGSALSATSSRTPLDQHNASSETVLSTGQPLSPNDDAGSALPTTPTIFSGNDIRRRWYPVIDYSRCTNCMECLDFCLFGVYGVDLLDRILVEQEDNCKKGCPACSRVCPANAIVFPEHKTPAIAGAEGGTVEDFKIDLSKLFGAPSALEMAVLERDVELVADGRTAVGVTVGLPKRQPDSATKSRDELDDLMDGLDSLDF